MPIRDDISSFLSNSCDAAARKKKLLIRIPTLTLETLNPQREWLDLFDINFYDSSDNSNYVYLRIFPEYTIENEVYGETGFKNTFSSSAIFYPKTTRRGFKASIKDRRLIILNIIRKLIDISESSVYNRFSPIKVIDFCHPELSGDDTITVNSETATVRWGMLAVEGSLPSTMQTSKGKFLEGDWEFSFKESRLRLN